MKINARECGVAVGLGKRTSVGRVVERTNVDANPSQKNRKTPFTEVRSWKYFTNFQSKLETEDSKDHQNVVSCRKYERLTEERAKQGSLAQRSFSQRPREWRIHEEEKVVRGIKDMWNKTSKQRTDEKKNTTNN